MVKQMVLQRNLLSEILFCTAKISIMVGQLLLCCRFSPTSLQLWELFVNVLGAERRQRPWCFTQHAELLLPWVGGGDLEHEPCPTGSGFELQGKKHSLPFPGPVVQSGQCGPSVFSHESSHHV